MMSVGQVLQQEMKKTNVQVGKMAGKELKITYCEKCHTPNSTIINLFGTTKLMPCMCECRKQEYDIKKQEERNRESIERLKRLRMNSLMDKMFESCTFNNFEVDELNRSTYIFAKNYVANWEQMKKHNIGFMLAGNPGVGKTHLVSCIANALLDKGVPVIFTSSIGLLSRYKETFKTKEIESTITNSLKLADLLIIDDLGVENDTSWVKEKLYEILDNRYRNKKPTIITTNLGKEALKKKLVGEDKVERTYDRLLEMCRVVYMEGRTRREANARSKDKIYEYLFKENAQ